MLHLSRTNTFWNILTFLLEIHIGGDRLELKSNFILIQPLNAPFDPWTSLSLRWQIAMKISTLASPFYSHVLAPFDCLSSLKVWFSYFSSTNFLAFWIFFQTTQFLHPSLLSLFSELKCEIKFSPWIENFLLFVAQYFLSFKTNLSY